jgi:hypothetical protein
LSLGTQRPFPNHHQTQAGLELGCQSERLHKRVSQHDLIFDGLHATYRTHQPMLCRIKGTAFYALGAMLRGSKARGVNPVIGLSDCTRFDVNLMGKVVGQITGQGNIVVNEWAVNTT